MARLTYLDEAGVSNPQQEPILVVAGVMIDFDKSLARVERYLSALIQTHIPPDMQPGFVLHAADLWGGIKRFRDRNRWPREKRWAILEAVCSIPKRFNLPVAFGYVDRSKFPDDANIADFIKSGGSREAAEYLSAFMMCGMMIERCMRNIARDEFTLLIAEDRDKVRGLVKRVQAKLKEPRKMAPDDEGDAEYFPYRHIKDTVHFATKSESAPLQIADACAFIIKRHLMRRDQSDFLYRLIEPQIIISQQFSG